MRSRKVRCICILDTHLHRNHISLAFFCPTMRAICPDPYPASKLPTCLQKLDGTIIRRIHNLWELPRRLCRQVGEYGRESHLWTCLTEHGIVCSDGKVANLPRLRKILVSAAVSC